MCGLVGFVDRRRRTGHAALQQLAATMAEALFARGPDDQATWADEKCGLAFGFRRLAIIDLTTAGRQPMISGDQNAVIVFNGEVYNAPALRSELAAQGIVFRGHSDTEVVLEACLFWGIEAALARFVGMFAFAYWDRLSRHLYLVRDRMGIKPLYYGVSGDTFFFGSQPKSFFAHEDWRAQLNPAALSEYLRFNFVPHHLSIYAGLAQVSPGAMVTLSLESFHQGHYEPKETHYWDFRAIAREGVDNRFAGSAAEATDKLTALLRQAVADRLVADVPLGAFLSGGIDSSTVVALMQEVAPAQVQTFSIGFAESRFDEAPFAKRIANRLGTRHSELYVSPNDARDLIPEISSWYDEPFADNSVIATYLVSRLARGEVTVALSGDGGDELFGGYPWYQQGRTIGGTIGRLPAGVRKSLCALLRTGSVGAWDRIAGLVPGPLRPERVGDRVHKLAALLELGSPDQIFSHMVSQWHEPGKIYPAATAADDQSWMGSGADDVPEFFERMLYYDTLRYLPDDILTKVDRASMAVSLEARVPILDHRIVEFAWQLPMSYRQLDGKPKGLLRRVLAQYVPTELFERPKQGFEMPIADWLRGELRDWAEDLLSEQALRADGLFEPAPIRRRWQEHQSGHRNWQYPLWNILMFQEWKRAWL